MNMFSQHGPVILKRDSQAKEQLAQLEELRGTLPDELGVQLERDMAALKAGIAGEEKVLFELENSHLPLVALHDLRLEYEGLAAQIDFLVITPQRTFVLECKNLIGDITIGEHGEFTRAFNGREREAIYSPVTQNTRHLELMRDMRKASKGLLTGLALDRHFEDLYRGFVVLANPKTRLSSKQAPEQVRQKVIRADQLVERIKTANAERGWGSEKMSWKDTEQLAQWWLEKHVPGGSDFADRYRQAAARHIEENGAAEHHDDNIETPTPLCPLCGAPMILRTAKRGKYAGKRFYGCSNYPGCGGIVNVEE